MDTNKLEQWKRRRMQLRKNKRKMIVVSLSLLTVMVMAVYGLGIALGTTTDVLSSDGSFEGTQYSKWSTATDSGKTIFSQDTTVKSDGLASAKMYISFTNAEIAADTSSYSHDFAIPSEGVTGVTLSGYYQASKSGAAACTWDAGWEIWDWSSGLKASGTLTLPKTSMTAFSTAVNGLEAGHRYTLRLYSSINKTGTGGLSVTSYWDQVKVNIDYNHSRGPVLLDPKPASSTVINGSKDFSVWAWDPAGINRITWEYKKAGDSSWTNIGNGTTVDGFVYSKSWDTSTLPDGDYDVRITGVDGLNVTSSTTVTYKLENQGPTVTELLPVSNSRLKGDQTLSARVADPAGVKKVTWEYSANGGNTWVPMGSKKQPASGTKYDGTYTLVFPTEDLPDMNNYKIRVTAEDSSYWAHATSTASQNYNIDNNPPYVCCMNPQMWSYLRGSIQTLTADVTDANGINNVQWKYSTDDGATWHVIGSDNTPTGITYSITWDTTAAGGDGTYLMEVVATNTSGDITTKTFNYYVDNTKPVLTRATVRTRNMVDVEFTDLCMNSTASKNPANYLIYEKSNPANTITVTDAQLKGDQRTIRLTTGNQTSGKTFTVEVNARITDAAGNALNTVAPNTNKVDFIGTESTTFYPHGNFASATELCAACHVTHTAEGPKLMKQPSEKLLCYMCHDASGVSTKNIMAEFGSIDNSSPNTSHHGVPNDLQSCINCHNPHDGEGVHYPKLLNVRDGNENIYHSTNSVCFGCHGSSAIHGSTIKNLTGIAGVDNHESYYVATIVYDGDRLGAHVYKNNGVDGLLAPPNAQTQINCNACHVEHGSQLPKLLRDSINGGTYNVEGNNNTLCFGCHVNSMGSGDAPYLGKTVFGATYLNAHGRKSSGVLYPGGPFSVSRTTDAISDDEQRGNCINCHNPHGTPNGKMLVDLYQVTPPDAPDAGTPAGILKYNGLCFKCHDADGPAQNIAWFYRGSYREANGVSVTASGHYVHDNGYTINGKAVPVGYCIPCNDCHNPHGSANNNKKLLNDRLGSNLYDGTTGNQRATCLKCHTATDDAVRNKWRGNDMPYLPNLASTWPQVTTINQHARYPSNPKPCSDCHGYGDPMQAAHAPEPHGRSPGGKDCDLCHNLTDMMSTGSDNYRHLVTSYTASYNPSGGTTCLSMCHTDHNVFNDENPPTFAGTDPGKHLRITGGNTTSVPTTGVAPSDDRGVNELCLSCHKNAQDNPDYSSPGGTEGTNSINDFVYGSNSWHPLMKAPHNSYVRNTLTPTWEDKAKYLADIQGYRMACTTCHNKINGTSGAKGPHSSSNKYMLRAVGPTTTQGVVVYDNLCNICHSSAIYGNGNTAGSGVGTRAPQTHSLGLRHYTPNAYGCYGCHSGNPDMLKEVTSGKEKSIGGGALRGSIHGRTYTFGGATSPTEALIHGNLISKFDPSANSCIAKVGTSECQMNSKAIQ